MTAIAQLEENRTVEGVYAVSRKRRLKTRNGSPYIALELVDPSGKIEARVWNDVELLDARFAEGDAVRVLGRVERHLLSVFAGQVSLVLDRAHAIDERHELLLAADRDRIARDLHDLVIQRLYATGLQLQAARPRAPEAVDEAIIASVRDLDTSIRDLRATIFELGRGRLLLQMGRLAEASVVLERRITPDRADEFVTVVDAAGVAALGQIALHRGDPRLARQSM